MLDFRAYRQTFLDATDSISNDKWSDFSNNPFFITAPQLEDIHLNNCRLFHSRDRMLEALPKQATIAEIGTQHGKFAEQMMLTTQPQKFHIIDIDLALFQNSLAQHSHLKQALEKKLVMLHKGDSSTVISTFPDSYFDWIYIDGDHSYEGVKKDIEKSHAKLKSDGLLVFNDYTYWSPYEMIPYGIPRAVNEFCLAEGWELILLALDSFLGYHDVAIRKIKAA